MSRIGMSDSDGEDRQSRDGNAIQQQQSYGFESFEVTSQQRRRTRRGQLHNSDDEEERSETRVFVCDAPGCPRSFTTKFKLVRHVLIHSGERRFVCPHCGRRFHRKDHLKNHLQVHNPNKTLHLCKFCQKTYCSLLSYRKHIALHAAEAGDLVCQLCGKVLADREGIMHHLKVHTGSRTLRGPSERKYPCDLCERSFFTKKDVKRHSVVHTGKRDFICQFCPQRFGRKDHLVRHTKKSHMNNPNGTPPLPDSMRKFEPSPSVSPDTSHKNGSLIMPSLVSDMSGLVISSTSSMMDEPVMDAMKPDSTYVPPPQPSLVQSNYGMNPMPNENGQGLARFSEPSLMPVSQYLPMSPPYPGVTPIMPHHYINMSTSNNILSDLLPPMTMAPTFPTSLSLDVGNQSLPHFSQAFQ